MIENQNKRTPQKPDGIFFDWDGTLVDSLGMLRKAHNHVRTEMGINTLNDEELTKNMHKSAREKYPEIYGDQADRALKVLFSYFENNHLKQLKAMHSAKELIETIASLDIPMGLVSNKNHKFLEKEVQFMNWTHHFLSIVGAGIAKRDKPNPDPLLLAIEKAELDNKNIWYIGDTETDILCAKRSDVSCIFVTNNNKKQNNCIREDILFEVSGCTELLEIIQLFDNNVAKKKVS